MQITLGTGVLTWNKEERITNRYGTVYLMAEGNDSYTTNDAPSLVDEKAATQFSGRYGKLVAEVVIARKSTHVGDHARSIYPETPNLGERILLGEGHLFTEPAYDGGLCVGLRPAEAKASSDTDASIFADESAGYLQVKMPGRAKDWLNPKALYRAHEQTVRLVFEPIAS